MAGVTASILTCAAAQAESVDRQITAQDITTPLLPRSSLQGDREFGGNGPIMDIRVELHQRRSGRAVFGIVHFEAREDSGDGSYTRLERRTFEI